MSADFRSLPVAQSKPRPALVLFDLGVDVVVCRITSVPRSGPLDASITDWQVAGLAKPSVARLNRLVTAEKTLLTTQLGQLTGADAAVIRTLWNTHMSL